MENNEIEKRCIGSECRALEKEGKRYIDGYAIVYEQKSKLINEWGFSFYETIKRGAADKLLQDPKLDVIATPNHNYEQVIGRTLSGTLQLINDEKGLRYIIEVPNTSAGNDIYESVKRGDTYESSFTFRVKETGQSWSTDASGVDNREIIEFDKLIEVAPVTWGAYANTAVNARGYKEFNETKTKPVKESNINSFKRKLTLIRLKNG